MSTSSSYILPSPPNSPHPPSSASSSPFANDDEEQDIDSLPSSSSSSSDSDSSEYTSDAQKEWEASLQQLELVLTMVIVPYAGKYFGRRFAYWSWAKYMTWMYPVEVRFTNKAMFSVAGAVEAAATL